MERLKELAEKYETRDFLNGDPSWFMHQVEGKLNQETFAFIASCLSYGSRKQFFPKIQYILDCSEGNVYEWVKEGRFEDNIPDNETCYYRLYTNSLMNNFLRAYRELILEYNSLGEYLSRNSVKTGIQAIEMITSYFSSHGIKVIVPKDSKSSCKRVCMFLRWMVRLAGGLRYGPAQHKKHINVISPSPYRPHEGHIPRRPAEGRLRPLRLWR